MKQPTSTVRLRILHRPREETEKVCHQLTRAQEKVEANAVPRRAPKAVRRGVAAKANTAQRTQVVERDEEPAL